MADIRIKDLPLATGPTAPAPSDRVALDGLTTRQAPLSSLADVINPPASQAEAVAGTNSSKRMTPLTTSQAISASISGLGLGSASTQPSSAFASALQGIRADTAIQPGDARILGLPGNVLSFGAFNNNTNATATSAAFQAAYNNTASGDVIVVPAGTYAFSTGVTGTSKVVTWEVHGNVSNAVNWADILPGIVNRVGRHNPINGVANSVVGRTDGSALNLTTTDNVDIMSLDIADNIKAFPGRVQGLAVYNRMKAGTTGIRQVLSGQVHVEAATGNSLGSDGQHYVGVQAGAFAYSPDGGTNPAAPSTSGGALFGMNSFAELKTGATAWKNITSFEFNTTCNAGTSVWYKSGIQIAGGGPVQGTVYDDAIAVSNLASAAVWKNGLHFHNANGAMPLNSTSTAIKFDLTTLGVGIDFGTTTTTTYIQGPGLSISPSNAQFTGTDQLLLLGNRTSVNSPRLHYFSSGSTNPDATVRATGGTGANNGNLILEAAQIVPDGSVRPANTGLNECGTFTYRWSRVYSNNLTLSPGIGTVISPGALGDLVIETTANNGVTFRLRGSDGTVRSATITLT